jgi:hypothetical protein
MNSRGETVKMGVQRAAQALAPRAGGAIAECGLRPPASLAWRAGIADLRLHKTE